MFLKKLSWEQYRKDESRLIQKLCKTLDWPDCIVGVARGGVVPAASIYASFMSEDSCLDLDMLTLSGFSRYHSDSKNLTSHDVIVLEVRTDKILLVDDIIDEGRTICELVRKLRNLDGEPLSIDVACVYAKKKGIKRLKNLATICQIYIGKIIADNIWLKYPWESDRK